MNLDERKILLERLGQLMLSTDPAWEETKLKAYHHNPWFIPEFIDRAVHQIAREFLQPEAIDELARRYAVPITNEAPKKVGIIMAGNIPLVGFHDLLCLFLTGNHAHIKLSSKYE